MEPTTDKKSNGALIGSIIIIVILVLGGIYIWMSKTNMPTEVQEEVQNEQQSLGELNQAAAIEAELGIIEGQIVEDAKADAMVEQEVNTAI